MTAMEDLVLTTLDRLVSLALTGQATRTDGTPLDRHVVYSHLANPRMVDPRDYANPFSPSGGSSLQGAMEAKGVPPVDPDAAAEAEAEPPVPGQKFRRAMSAAFRTARLVDPMLMVTKDGTYQTYSGSGRSVASAYESILAAMQPVPPPPVAPEVQARIDAAEKVLYEIDEEDGTILGPSDLFRRYQKNARAYAQAKADFATQQALILADPVRAESFPMIAATLQQAVDDAWDNFRTGGTTKVERALDTIEAVGVDLGQNMVAKARQVFDAWKLNLAGVPTTTPYAYVDPTRWYDPEEDIGWTHLVVTEKAAHEHVQAAGHSFARSFFENHSQSTSGGGGLSVGFAFVGGQGGGGTTDTGGGHHDDDTATTSFHNDAQGLTIDIEWGLAQIERPWLVDGLFHMRNWYMVGQRERTISTGAVDDQVDREDQLLPMIPLQFVVIRNVRIHADQWASDEQTLKQAYADAGNSGHSENGFVKGGGGLSLGFVTVGGSAGHEWSNESGEWWNSASSESSTETGWKFENGDLVVKGSQIVGWISKVLPPCPPLPDPGLDAPAERVDSTDETDDDAEDDG